MKWKNKGHEFDEIAYKLKNSKIYLFGAGDIGKRVYESLEKEEVVGVIDNNTQKQSIDGKKIYALKDVKLTKDEVIVICVSNPVYRKEIYRQLLENNIAKEQIIDYALYMQIRWCYEKDKVIFNGLVSIWLTQRCTLNCKHCVALFPYMEHQKDIRIEELIEELELLLEKIDYIKEIGIAGGETFLYKELLEYIENIGKYRHRIGSLFIVTNGTLVPEHEVLLAIKKYQIAIVISVYPDVIDNMSERREALIQKLEEYEIQYSLVTREKWVKPLCEKGSRKELNCEELENFFDECHTGCRLYKDKKMYYCLMGKSMLEVGLLSKEDEDNAYNLETLHNKKELIEFDNGYNHKGYVEACKYCNGYLESNKNYVPVAEQISRENAKEYLLKKILG